MGCVSSKQKGCSHCNTPYSPVPNRSYSMHVHHPPQTKGDSYHVVALTSTTLGSLDLASNHINGFMFSNGNKVTDSNSFRNREKESEAKTWSNMIEHKLPKAISKTPIETINTWELMEGLEDTTTPFQSPHHFRSFSFDVNLKFNGHVDPPHKPSFIVNNDMFHQMTEEGSNLKAEAQAEVSDFPSLQEKKEGMVRKGLSFEEKKMSSGDDDDDVVDFKNAPFFEKEKVVLYFTSLHGVRRTYEDCCNVRLILKGLRVRVDERDVSMHLGFKEEMKELLGDEYGKGGTLPRLFVGRKYIGGAEDILKLHEDGKLEKLLNCCERIDDVDAKCEACGDIRFVPCETCFGSCKIYYYEGDDDEEEDAEYGFRRCLDCNENGLIRCPSCCY